MKKSCTKPVRGRKIRIIVSDPYATDDSSDDEWFESKPPKVKRIVREINLPFQLSESSQYLCDGVKSSGHKASMQLNKHVGVRRRRSGKWPAQITNPITRTKVWLDTFETLEETGKAYADENVEFDEWDSSGTAVSSSVASVDSQCLRSPASSSSASGPCVNGDDDLSKEEMSLRKDVDVSGDSSKEDFDFSELEIPDLSFLAALEESTISGANGAELDFDWFLRDEDSGHMLDDFSFLDNVNNISGIENSVPSELIDCDFLDTELEHGDIKFAFADQLASPLNIACP